MSRKNYVTGKRLFWTLVLNNIALWLLWANYAPVWVWYGDHSGNPDKVTSLLHILKDIFLQLIENLIR